MAKTVFKGRILYIILVLLYIVSINLLTLTPKALPLYLSMSMLTIVISASFAIALFEYLLKPSKSLMTYKFFDQNFMLFLAASVGVSHLALDGIAPNVITFATCLVLLILVVQLTRFVVALKKHIDTI